MYVDSILDKEHDKIHVVERVNGQRVFKEYPSVYTFYYSDPKGKYRTIFDTPVTKFSTKNRKEFQKEVRLHSGKKLWESDLNPIFRCLSEHYLNVDAPKLHTCFWDIEVDMQPYAAPSDKKVNLRKRQNTQKIPHFSEEKEVTVFELGDLLDKDNYEVFDESSKSWVPVSKCSYLKIGPGYAPTTDPFNKITAISLYLDWLDKLITLVLPPASLPIESAEELISKFDNTFLFETEEDLLDTFLNLIDDADVISGWNSAGFDVPYTINRITRVLSKNDTRRFCLWDQLPKKRKFERFGAETETYDLVGRTHLDYMELYRKYTYEERHSYSLDAIGEYELNERKIAYTGTLDELYNKDFYTFIDYNRQDTILLAKLDKKLKFLDLANAIAHSNTVLLQTTMGAVAVTEQAIINDAHAKGLIVPDRKKRDWNEDNDTFGTDDNDEINLDDFGAAGAYVAYPKIGMHEWIGSVDINSLYPSTIRALNMGPETIVGQIRPILTDNLLKERMKNGASFAAAWENVFGTLEYQAVINRDEGVELTIDWESGETTTHTATEIWQLIFASNQKWTLSANGTIFTYEKEGIIPGLLARWYSDRQQMQKMLHDWEDLNVGILIPNDIISQLK